MKTDVRRLKTVQNPMGTYRLSHGATYATAGILFAVGLVLPVVYLSSCFQKPEKFHFDIMDAVILLVLSGVPLLFGASFVYSVQRIKRIMRLGEKITGEVAAFYRFDYSHGSHLIKTKPANIMLIVQYHYISDRYSCINVGHGDPNKILGSDKCDVYIYNNYVFVTGFTRRKEWDEAVSIPEVPENYL